MNEIDIFVKVRLDNSDFTGSMTAYYPCNTMEEAVQEIMTLYKEKTINSQGILQDFYRLIGENNVEGAIDLMQNHDKDVDRAIKEYNAKTHDIMRRGNKTRKNQDPYITEKLSDKSRYQTVYAKVDGSAAAPTAGLHFTEELLQKIRAMGVKIVPVVLHVGIGTFRPVKEDDITRHPMHSEYFFVPEETAREITAAKKEGRRVISVGTTSCRTLESAFEKGGALLRSSGNTDIFIYPGYTFKCVDALITNFHLPESTLIMLVCALLGYDNTMAAYRHAVAEKYRFFSFGDAMFIR